MSQSVNGEADPIPAVWDGRRFAFDAGGRSGVVALIAHTASSQLLMAVRETMAGPCVTVLPGDCRHVEFQFLVGGALVETIAVELDDLLLPDLVTPGLSGLRVVSCALAGGVLTLGAATDPLRAGEMRCFNLVGGAIEGGASFKRLRVGPLHDPAGPGRRILIGAESGPGGVLLAASGDDAKLLAAHVFGSANRSSEPHDAPDNDASGASALVCRERGFRMMSFAEGESSPRLLGFADFAVDDEVIVLTPRGHVVAWAEDPERTGSRLFLSRAENGDWSARVVSTAYRPATATAMAALGSGGAMALFEGGATATPKGADFAADLAEAIWRRQRVQPPATPGWLATVPPSLAPQTTLAGLSSLGEEDTPGLSPAIAGLAPAFGVAVGALEEIDALPLADRLAIVLWFAEDPTLAMRSLRRRLLLPSPAVAPAPARIAALLAWSEEPDLIERLEAAAERIGSASPDDRDGQRFLRQAAARLGEGWIDLDSLSAAETVMRVRASAGSDTDAGPLQRLLARLRSDRDAFAAVQVASRGLDLGQLAEWRSSLVVDAEKAAQPPTLIGAIASGLPTLSAVDITLLHRHFRKAAVRIEAFGAIREAVSALDAAAANGGLSARMDRDGDMLVGMTRLGSSSEAAVRALTRVPAARPALLSLTRFIDRHVEPDPADPVVRELRRNLQSYGCLLLAQAIARECAEAMATAPAGGVGAAWRERLRSGVVEMLPAYVLAAGDALTDDVSLGSSLIDRLQAGP